jgi:ABC-type multidrug transport system permease subunit
MPNSIQGTQNQLFAVFLLLTIFTNFCQQMMPHAVTRRELAEARELPSKAYSWQAFILSDILIEIPWNSLMAVLVFICWYYPIGLQKNAADANQTAERGVLMFLFVLAFFNFAGTFASMALALMNSAENAGNITNLLISLSLIFCGYVQTHFQIRNTQLTQKNLR